MNGYKHIEEFKAGEILVPELEDRHKVPCIQEDEIIVPLHTVLSYNEEQGMSLEDACKESSISEEAYGECIEFLEDSENLHEAARILHIQRNHESSDWAKSMAEDIWREFEASDEKQYEGEIDLGNSPKSVIRRSYVNIIESSSKELEINYDPEEIENGDEIHLEGNGRTLLVAGYCEEENTVYIDSSDEEVAELRVDADSRKEVRNRITEVYKLLSRNQ